MAKVSFVDIPSGMEDAYKNVLQAGDRFTFSRVRVKQQFLSRERVKGVTVKSVMVALAPIWAAMSPTDQAAWVAAGLVSKLSGWKMFVQDTAARMRGGFSGYATPNNIYQSMVGRIEVVAPATGLQIEQAHPSIYYVLKKIAGTKAQYSPVPVSEPFSLPLTIGIAWHTALTAVGGGGTPAEYGGCERGGVEYGTPASGAGARFFCNVISSYQSRDIITTVEIDFGLSDAWQSATATLSTVLGTPRYYECFIEVYNARGNLYFDNVSIFHDGENWARDPLCNNISQEFTHAFIQVAKHWAPVAIADGADYGSIYFVP